ncbi:MAG: MazG nucleotide pyrophosphohydrolase domain-containing protein [Armatimonadota bacterium]|nr:MazG nucleotide pyrophosphohydrolase domain-containing protein [Armatimonadota bacterium]MDR7402447.1 MazG nucleotide pyrophosphohydrolase domain-containing protein [Armatimonadota bacterium]MDR7403770.1 MazG nucleotide pyrophosphohydrolase domain-containing protein [Armatimonadota bacterium]MDR7437901.1 MazG nucleotide pyrophosphohydrolase domain-containing protein [Armatimonadota bacterium]MDR7472126.1 MazG nucleotide pyrophosphohydrolase domain-containing protein [Armatimonadota bacterium
MQLREFQRRIALIYGERDRRRGADGTFRWLVEEVGELARALRDGSPASLREEIADVLAWTTSLATLCGVDIEQAASRYADACPKCGQTPCACPAEASP